MRFCPPAGLTASALCAASAALFLSACAPPNPSYLLGRTTDKGRFRAGFVSVVGLPVETIKALGEGSLAALQIVGGDSVEYDDEAKKVQESLLRFALQPFSTGYEFYLRYGFLRNLDAGYKYASGKHVGDLRYQFMGDKGNLRPNEDMDGSIGLQFSAYDLELPRFYQLRRIQDTLDFRFKKQEIFVPVSLSRRFSKKENYGGFGFGGVFGMSHMDYSFGLTTVDKETGERHTPVSYDSWYPAFGGFLNVELGYKYVFANASISFLHEDFGTVKGLNGEGEDLSGTTLTPCAGIYFLF